MTVAIGSEPPTIDPQVEASVDEVSHSMLVFSALMTFDPKTLQPIPDAAKEPPKVSADGLTYTFTLKDGLLYSDGVPLKAKDFVYGFKRLCDPAVASDYAFTGYVVVGCEKYNTADAKKTPPEQLAQLREAVAVRAIDDRTVEYRLTEKAPYFVSIMGLWVGVPSREDMVTKGGKTWTEPDTFVGNGWFKLTEWKHNERMVFERNENHAPKAKLKRIVKVVIPEAAVRFASYRNDEIDLYTMVGEDRKAVESDPTLSAQLQKLPGSCTFYLAFNNVVPPFDDPKVRLAFAKAVDRDALVRDVYQGLAAAVTSFMPPGFPNYESADDTQRFDPAAAKRLLAESRYGSSLPPIQFGFVSRAVNKTRTEWFVGQWKQHLGVDVGLLAYERATYQGKALKDRPQLGFGGWCADYPDPQDWLTTVFHSTASINKISVGYKSEEFDRLTRQADAEPDPKKREELYARAQRILTQDAPGGFMLSSTNWLLVKPWVKGYTTSSMDFFLGIFRIGDLYVTR